jgi:hypothetical protein
VSDSTSQRLLSKPANVQILDGNQTEARNQPESELVVKVPSLVFDFPLCLRQQYRRFAPPVAPTFTACRFPLCPPQDLATGDRPMSWANSDSYFNEEILG